MKQYTAVLLILLLCSFGKVALEDVAKEPGHNRPFGSGRPIYPVDAVQQFPDPQTFFKMYFYDQKPVKFTGGGRFSPAFKLWTDKYFLDMDIPRFSFVHVESRKKEDRNLYTQMKTFKNFVKAYNNTELYMVDQVPDYLLGDIVLPFSLQCPDLMAEKLVDKYMWFSDGGTSSVVHFDLVDNINCVYRGSKDFLLVNPYKYDSLSLIDVPSGGYSSLDVDKMDYERYPSLAEIDYISAHLESGDCLFIPYKWIHQVRSKESNIAVNIWFNHHETLKTDVTKCYKYFNTSITLDKLDILGISKMDADQGGLINTLTHELAKAKGYKMDSSTFLDVFFPEINQHSTGANERIENMKERGRELIKLLDEDGNGFVTQSEVYRLPPYKITEAYYLFYGQKEVVNVKKGVFRERDEL